MKILSVNRKRKLYRFLYNILSNFSFVILIFALFGVLDNFVFNSIIITNKMLLFLIITFSLALVSTVLFYILTLVSSLKIGDALISNYGDQFHNVRFKDGNKNGIHQRYTNLLNKASSIKFEKAERFNFKIILRYEYLSENELIEAKNIISIDDAVEIITYFKT